MNEMNNKTVKYAGPGVGFILFGAFALIFGLLLRSHLSADVAACNSALGMFGQSLSATTTTACNHDITVNGVALIAAIGGAVSIAFGLIEYARKR